MQEFLGPGHSSASGSQLGLERVLISVGIATMSGISFICRTQNAKMHDPVLDPADALLRNAPLLG